MFRASACPSSGATTTAVAASGLPSELGDSSAVGRGRADRPDHDQQHCYHHVPMVKPAATAIELLMMDMRMPETCWAVFKRQAINLRNYFIWLVDSFECMMMHGFANPKLIFVAAATITVSCNLSSWSSHMYRYKMWEYGRFIKYVMSLCSDFFLLSYWY